MTAPPPGPRLLAPGAGCERLWRRPVVIITGLSGAGLSTALKRLEDLGFEAVDNLPMGLIAFLVDPPAGPGTGDEAGDGDAPAPRPVAATIDSRSRHFSAEALRAVAGRLKARPDLAATLVFMDCADETLLRRFTETRRRHPLAQDRPVIDGIDQERRILGRLRDDADLVIDTSLLSIHDLRRVLAGHFRQGGEPGLHVVVTSFSFGMGVPREADLVFDVRFLANPHYDPDLRPLTGLDPRVQARVAADPDFERFFDRLRALLAPLLPRYAGEGKSYLTIAIGCTGGKHRSVFVTERLAAWLRETGIRVGLSHRELERSGAFRSDRDGDT